VTLTPTSLAAGGSGQATFIARDSDGGQLTGRTATWSSSNQNVATVHATNGTVSAVSAGQANIIATVEGKTGSAPLTVTEVGPTGTVTGFVMAADGVTPIPDALVEVASTGFATSARSPLFVSRETRLPHTRDAFLKFTPDFAWATSPPEPLEVAASVSTRSALDGSYTLQGVPAGPQVIIASRGAFTATVNVSVVPNQQVTAPPASLTSTGKLAYVFGLFDAIQTIVEATLGNDVESIDAEDLGNSAITSQYRIIFLNCGLNEVPATDPTVIANLKAFLQSGGTIYASDWAAAYVTAMFPGFTFDLIGEAQSITGTVVDASLQAFVGTSQVDITYDFDAWAAISAIPGNASMLLRGNYITFNGSETNRPLAIVIPHGAGKLVFTTFHYEFGATPDQLNVLRHFIYLP
jgi:hypothetical protein